MEQSILRKEATRLIDTRTGILTRKPFYGRLLMRLSFGFEECGTAYTDMKKIVFDPEFSQKLSDAQLEFVLLHELLHCVLKHCTRGFGKLPGLYNIACDIVVNSLLLEEFGMSEMTIGGNNLMHIAPNGEEGRKYTAEEVYQQLVNKTDIQIINLYGDGGLDSHDLWNEIASEGNLNNIWDFYVRDSMDKTMSGTGSLGGLINRNCRATGTSKVDWKTVLHDFIQHDRSDYLFSAPDRRYSFDIVLPSFCENVDGCRVDNIWFVIDTSSSVSIAGIEQALYEVQMAIEQIGGLEGMLSFFDVQITEPIPFDAIDDIKDMVPVGGGGTNFNAIFKKLRTMAAKDELPVAIVVVTDGYANFPDEKDSLNVPVIWIIIDSLVEPPWGTVVHLETEV